MHRRRWSWHCGWIMRRSFLFSQSVAWSNRSKTFPRIPLIVSLNVAGNARNSLSFWRRQAPMWSHSIVTLNKRSNNRRSSNYVIQYNNKTFSSFCFFDFSWQKSTHSRWKRKISRFYCREFLFVFVSYSLRLGKCDSLGRCWCANFQRITRHFSFFHSQTRKFDFCC